GDAGAEVFLNARPSLFTESLFLSGQHGGIDEHDACWQHRARTLDRDLRRQHLARLPIDEGLDTFEEHLASLLDMRRSIRAGAFDALNRNVQLVLGISERLPKSRLVGRWVLGRRCALEKKLRPPEQTREQGNHPDEECAYRHPCTTLRRCIYRRL